KETFNLIARVSDKQGHTGEDRTFVKFSGADGSSTELLNDGECSFRGGECSSSCASSANIVGTCTTKDGQARVCCKAS
ncbi:hypothetical protein KY312_04860, partial [Candidatus Woesearchaeota archaeon]|nr:hypothetical protein [Candidatus Woesearchaeota archaeon]